MADEDEYVSLATIAERTGVSVRSLREWCATGRLACERFGGTWAIRTADSDEVRQLAERRPRPPRHATLVLPVEVSTTDVERTVMRAFGLTARNVSKVRPTIDDMEYVGFSADAETEAIERARLVVEGFGGQLLDP